ncbi:hypothetical protein ACH4GZ_38705 [Streptomyces hygroscopicus]|uniref:hypothetical protein n=1 Tax=Streptomyces hygroscopicus TaxID=1912 RepID=UPI00379298B4
MIREECFLVSRMLYAVDLASLSGTLDATGLNPVYRGNIDAIWFRRRKGATVACIGQLWDFQTAEPTDATEFLARLTDGRSGGRCHGRWNGTSYWGEPARPDERDAHLGILRPMLANYPNVPDGYDGWWRF